MSNLSYDSFQKLTKILVLMWVNIYVDTAMKSSRQSVSDECISLHALFVKHDDLTSSVTRPVSMDMELALFMLGKTQNEKKK